jgi:hypothetical protein
MEGRTFLLQKEKERSLYREVTFWKDGLFGLDQELSGFLGAMRDTIDDSFDDNSVIANESGDVSRRMWRMKIKMDRKNSKDKEEERDDP